jgi:murein DD-endopeptidase MepM/ murein hydrolase activator NlpD
MILSLGSNNDDVKTLQAALRALSYYQPPARIDGEFGPITEKAVRAFQADNGLVVDGIVGSKTWSLVLKPVARAPWPIPRAWPLRALADGRVPVVTSGHSSRNPSRPTHHGVDIMYPYRPGDPPTKIGDGGRTRMFWIPPNTHAIAPFDGRIVLANNSATGQRAWLQHPSGWAAGFFHLDKIYAQVGQVVTVGDSIGRVADSPRGDDPDHLHFEIYWGDVADDVKGGRYPRGSVDPELMLRVTPYLPT